MSNDKEYNGWSNYETWLVNLWIDNEQGTQNFWNCRAEELFEAARASQSFTKSEQACVDLADDLKDEYERHVEDQLPASGFLRDLANAALSEVNWGEIADALLEESTDGDDEYETRAARSSYA